MLGQWEEKKCLLQAGECAKSGAVGWARYSWGPVALTAVSFSSALKRSSQATADFWKASCRLMRLSTSSTVQPSSALRTNGSWLHSQASAIPASLPNTSTSKTAGKSGWATTGYYSHSSFKHRDTEKATAPEQELRAEPGSAKGGGLEFHAPDSWSHLLWKLQGARPPAAPSPPRAWSPQFPTAAHQAAASPSSPATCQLSPGAVPEAETASLRSGSGRGVGGEMRVSTQRGLARVPGGLTWGNQ